MKLSVSDSPLQNVNISYFLSFEYTSEATDTFLLCALMSPLQPSTCTLLKALTTVQVETCIDGPAADSAQRRSDEDNHELHVWTPSCAPSQITGVHLPNATHVQDDGTPLAQNMAETCAAASQPPSGSADVNLYGTLQEDNPVPATQPVSASAPATPLSTTWATESSERPATALGAKSSDTGRHRGSLHMLAAPPVADAPVKVSLCKNRTSFRPVKQADSYHLYCTCALHDLNSLLFGTSCVQTR
jgi:hypothetical protein